MQADSVNLSSETLTAEIAALGAELRSLATRDGRDLQWNGDPAVWRGKAPILFPVIGLLEGGAYRWNDRSYPMPKHGFARHSTSEIVDVTTSTAEFRLSASDAIRAIYPFQSSSTRISSSSRARSR